MELKKVACSLPNGTTYLVSSERTYVKSFFFYDLSCTIQQEAP